MILGFNVDYWKQKDIEKAIADFGKLLVWEEDPNHPARIIVKARVAELTEIPWFIVCFEGEDFEGDSWTAQCEILQARPLGGVPPDEDIPPNGPNDIQPTLFEFFGFGQPGQGPHQNADDANQNDNANDVAGNGNEPMDADVPVLPQPGEASLNSMIHCQPRRMV
jgi:hypothetical protein